MRALALLCAWGLSGALAGDWPQFRGPSGDGHYRGAPLPTEWGPDRNVAWKTAIPGKGWSSPIVSKGKVFLTTAVPNQAGDQSLRAVCVDAARGTIDWNVEVFQVPKAKLIAHSKNSHASPTPTTDGDRIYVHFGHMGTAALDRTGRIIWTRTGLYEKPVHGNGGSPILVDGRLIFSCDALDKQAVVALNALDGKTVWVTPRNSSPGRPFSFSTPTLLESDGRKTIVSIGSDIIAAYDAKTGEEIWRSKFSGYSLVPKPVIGHGMVYFATGYDSPVLKAVRLGGRGDVTASHAVWTVARNAPNTPSPLLIGDLLFTVSDRGIASCMDARSGQVLWEERLKGAYSASPITADGKIYLTAEDGKGTLLEAARSFRVLGEFDMKERTFASFAAAEEEIRQSSLRTVGALYIRTETQLYKFTAASSARR